MSVQPQNESHTYDDFFGMTVSSLKDFLSLRGLSQSGKKVELVARAFGAYELNVPTKYSQEEINRALKVEYQNRLKQHGISTDPKSIPDAAWIDDVSKWPELDDGKLFSYILKVKAVETDYIGAYKDQKAYSYWMSGFVGAVWICASPTDKDVVFLKSEVCPSQRIHDDPHKVWVCVKGGEKNHSLCTSWCTCIAGSGEACNHVIALLYKVNYAYKKSYISPACTSVPQGWNKGTKKEVKPSRISDVVFRKDKKTKKGEISTPTAADAQQKFDPRHSAQRVMTDERVSLLLHGVKNVNPGACVFTSVGLELNDGIPPTIIDAASDFISSSDIVKPIEENGPSFLESIQLNTTQVKKLERITRGQQTNNVWYAQRCGRITASNIHDVYTKTNSILKKRGKKKHHYSQMVDRIIHKGNDISRLPAIKWGVTHESDGVKSFLSTIGPQHEGGLEGFHECGMFIRADRPFLAGSPDGLFRCKCCAISTVEVKCPFSVRNMNVHLQEVYSQVDFLEDEDGKPRLRRNHKYFTQVQIQMWLVNAPHAYFIVWTQGHPPLIEKVTLDLEYVMQVVNTVTLFYKTYVLPCILSYRDIFRCPKCDKVILEEPEVNNDDEDSVCCDTCNAWWHLPCAEFKRSEEDVTWICSYCLTDIATPPEEAMVLSTFEEGSQGCSTDVSKVTTDLPGACTVCCSDAIPVGGEHKCSKCRNSVHAWCSNHEQITDSSLLLCNNCLP